MSVVYKLNKLKWDFNIIPQSKLKELLEPLNNIEINKLISIHDDVIKDIYNILEKLPQEIYLTRFYQEQREQMQIDIISVIDKELPDWKITEICQIVVNGMNKIIKVLP